MVDELFMLMDDEFKRMEPIYGLIFLFKHDKSKDKVREIDENHDPEMFFANQTVHNACATQALLSILLNINKGNIKDGKDVDIGNLLNDFKSFSLSLPPQIKGDVIGEHNEIKKIHNSFARPEPFVSDGIKRIATKDDDVYHFIAYIPFKDYVYELDGLQKGPIKLCEINKENDSWVNSAVPHIQERIQLYSETEIRFNLMAVTKDQRVVVKDKINKLKESSNVDENQVYNLQQDLKDLESKFESWKAENIRRKHNYIPFIMNLLQVLAKEDKLPSMIDKAKERRKELLEKQKLRKQQQQSQS